MIEGTPERGDWESPRDVERKLAVLREAVRHAYPTADIEDMLREIGRGYRGIREPGGTRG